LLRLTREKRAAVVHIYLGNIAAKMLDYLRQERAARIVSFHGGDLAGEMTDAEFEGLCQNTDLFLARSRSLAEALQERGCPPERIRLNTTGVPLPEPFTPKSTPPAGRTVRMLQACRLIGKKGLDVSLQTVARLVRQGRDVTLDLAGAGPEEPMLRALAQELGIAARVRFMGFVENAALLRALSDYDVFVHPSRTTASGDREGIPNSLLEAMAYGVPVVATRHSGIPEAVTHENSGLLIDAAEPEALARAVETLLDHPALYARISRAARETVSARFSLAACGQKLEASYHEAMALAQGRRPRINWQAA
jgi:glycosyltransferase involved in cell wall biosynthesis